MQILKVDSNSFGFNQLKRNGCLYKFVLLVYNFDFMVDHAL